MGGDYVLDANRVEIDPFLTALRASRLTQLHVENAASFGPFSMAPARLLLGAAAGHATLRTLRLRGCPALGAVTPAAFGDALAAAAATLHELDVSNNRLNERTVAPLLAAVTQQGCTLRRLALDGPRFSRAFEEGALADALRQAPPSLKFELPWGIL